MTELTLDQAPTTEQATHEPRSPVRRLRLWLLVATVVLVISAATLAVLAQRAQGVREAQDAALASAATRIPVLLSYDHDELAADLDRAVDQTTGSFRAEYRKVITTAVKPIAEREKVDNAASVSGLAVVRGAHDEVVLLAFITQTTSTAGGNPVVSGSRAEVTLRRGDRGPWLISGLKSV